MASASDIAMVFTGQRKALGVMTESNQWKFKRDFGQLLGDWAEKF
jgi:hypothetical protein